MFNPIQFIVNYDSQKFSVINFLDTGSIYMDGRTNFFFTLGSEYHKMYVLSTSQKHLILWIETSYFTN